MRRSKLAIDLLIFFLVGPLATSAFAQVELDVDVDLEVKADMEVLARERLAPAQKRSSSAVELVNPAIVLLDEERLYQDLSQQWVLTQRDLREFKTRHRPACEQNTDLKANEWHFLRRIGEHIHFQAQRIRETYDAANDPVAFAETKFQSMLSAAESFKLQRPDRADPNQMRTDVSTAAVNLLLSEMSLRAEAESIQSGGVWQLGSVPIPRRIVISFVQDQLVIFAWFKWAAWLQRLPGVQRFLKESSRSVLVRLSPKNLPAVCRSPLTVNACAHALRLTRRGVYTLARGSQVLVFQSGAVLGGIALWSDVWSHALSLSSWYYLRIPRWREKMAIAVNEYNAEIRDLCFFRQCFETRMLRRVTERREKGSVAEMFVTPSDPHFQLKRYCEKFGGGKK